MLHKRTLLSSKYKFLLYYDGLNSKPLRKYSLGKWVIRLSRSLSDGKIKDDITASIQYLLILLLQVVFKNFNILNSSKCLPKFH